MSVKSGLPHISNFSLDLPRRDREQEVAKEFEVFSYHCLLPRV